MKTCSLSLVVGIGSPHGDDQAGWRLIDLLAEHDTITARFRKALVPHDILDWLDDCHTLHIVDACDSGQVVQRFDDTEATRLAHVPWRSTNSHQFGIVPTLQLAASLDRLPRRVSLWAIPGTCFDSGAEITKACAGHITRCAEQIESELAAART